MEKRFRINGSVHAFRKEINMLELITGKFLSSDQKNEIFYRIYEPQSPRAIIQISHGMCEHTARYSDHAEFFATQGFILAGNDHLGHGRTAKDTDGLGYIGNADFLVDDVAAMTDLLHTRYPNLPIFLLGHSMGSFILRDYMTKYSDKISGAIVSGTAGPESPTALGDLVAATIGLFKGEYHRSKLLFKLSNGSYSKSFGKDAPITAWLSSVERVGEKYQNDDRCGFIFTVNGYRALFSLLGRVSKTSWAKKVPRELPVLMISGEDDPVGGFGHGVRKIHERLCRANLTDLTLKMWAGGRHELLNEAEHIKNDVYKTVTDWINERM